MGSTLPTGFFSRAATIDDAETAVDLVNACSIELIGVPEFEPHQFRTDWSSPDLNPGTDLHLVFAPDDRLVGYAGLWDGAPFVEMFGWGNVHPDYQTQGIGTYLAQWVEGRARQSMPKGPEGARVALLQSRQVVDGTAQALLLRQGYQVVRYSSHMLIEMDAAPPKPVFPPGITVRNFDRAQDLRDLILTDREIFRDHWGYVESPFEDDYQNWAHWIDTDPDFDPTLWFVALDGDEIVGISLCHTKVAEDPEVGYVNTLGVRRAWRRQGIALALLHHSFGELYRRGRRAVALDVDAQNLTGATRLYEKAGMHVQRQTVVYEKELRPGVDLRNLSAEG